MSLQNKIQTQSTIYCVGLSVLFLVCRFHVVSSLESDLGAVAWGTLSAPSKCDCGWRACVAGPLESRPPTLHIKGLPLGSSCKVEGIGRRGTWGQAGRRENLQLMFLVAAPAGGAVAEGSEGAANSDFL